MSAHAALPPGFEELQPFVVHWAGATTNDRVHARSTLPLEEIRAFYDAMLPRVEAAMDHIDAIGLHQLPEDAATLARLVLALGQASIAIEVHGAALAPGTHYPHGIVLERGPPPFG